MTVTYWWRASGLCIGRFFGLIQMPQVLRTIIVREKNEYFNATPITIRYR